MMYIGRLRHVVSNRLSVCYISKRWNSICTFEYTPSGSKLTQKFKMVRLAVALLFVVAVAYVVADEDEDNSCAETKDCPCGSVCNDGACAEGCMLYNTFLAAGARDTLYGRKCHCGETPDERGMLLECAEGVEFTGAPEGVAEWENNPACEAPAATEGPAATEEPAPTEEPTPEP